MPSRNYLKCFCFALVQFITVAALLYPSNAFCAKITMPKIFSHHMVLQREKPVPVWGWASPGGKVTVEFAGQRKETTAGADGRWEIRLDPMPACKEGKVLIVSSGSNKSIEFDDVVVGEVWICSGQSNMAFGLRRASEAQEDINAADLPDMRIFQVFNVISSSPNQDVSGRAWTVCSNQTAAGWTAVGFYFGRRLLSELDVPVGLISAAWGGTMIEPWTPLEAFSTVPELTDYIVTFRKVVKTHRQALPDKMDTMEKWINDARKAIEKDKELPVEPVWPVYPVHNRRMPAACYNAMIYPLIPYAIRGAIWYQGETNTGNPEDIYYHKMRALIGGWRHAWAQADFPFYYVQLASFNRDYKQPTGGRKWANLRNNQLKALAITNTGMAVAIDIGEAKDIHPKNKFDVGERLARWALARDYGKTNIVVSGPLYREMNIEGNHIRIMFDYLGGGLMVSEKIGRNPAREIKNGKLKRFAIAGADKKWVWADAVIDGNTVVVSSPDVPKPVAVRYAYSNNPEGCNLYNRAGLPASPFRTDTW